MKRARTKIPICLLLCAFLFVSSNCAKQEEVVVVYTALDRNFSEPIFELFTERTGIRVLPKYDTESTKTVGLVNTIIAEADHPRCDVFWNNEILNTLRLQERGLLQPCEPAEAARFPDSVQDPDGMWYGFAARARVLIVNTNLLPETEWPRRAQDLLDPDLKGRVGIAKPLFGTTASHVACLFTVLGEDEAKAFLNGLKENGVSVEAGNKTCAVNVAKGRLAVAWTDTDDAMIELRRGAPVHLIYPDSAPGEIGTLLIPNTLALIKDCPNPEAGRKLIDFLLSSEVEEILANSEL